MGYRLIVTKEAHQDIDEIVTYIASELKNLQAAGDFLNDVERGYTKLADNPFVYSVCNDKRLKRLGYRKLVIKNYLLLYRISENKVYIVRVVYSARDYAKLL